MCISEWERRMDMEQISVSYIPLREVDDTMLGCIQSTISRVATSLLIFHRTITVTAAIVMVYWRDKIGRSSEWEWLTDMEQISVSYIPHREVKDTMLGWVQPTNSRAEASPLIFHSTTIAAIVVVYWRDKIVHSSEWEWHTDMEQISVSYVTPR